MGGAGAGGEKGREREEEREKADQKSILPKWQDYIGMGCWGKRSKAYGLEKLRVGRAEKSHPE